MSGIMKKPTQTYSEVVEYLYKIPLFTTKNETRATDEFLIKLKNPQNNMKIIHIAGTNGKGSVCAYLRSVMQEMGYQVGTFTSPHLVELRERLCINGIWATEEEIVEVYEEIQIALEEFKKEHREYHPTFFEFLFFMSLLYFQKKDPDYVILETGLGGRLDATNSIKNPMLTVITRIGMDHMEYLGDSLDKIALEKAGIIKPGIPVVYDDNVPPASQIIVKIAQQLHSPIVSVSKKDYTLLNFKNKTIDFCYQSRYYEYIRLRLCTTAFYQMENASLALRCAEEIFEEKELTPNVLQTGIYKAFWEGRMEEVLPEVYVDGAHNEDGIQAFIESVELDECAGKRFLIFGVVKEKAYTGMVKLLMESRLFHQVAVVNIENARTLSLSILEKTFAEYKEANVDYFGDVWTAYQALHKQIGVDDKIYIVGSLYLVGEFKSRLRNVNL